MAASASGVNPTIALSSDTPSNTFTPFTQPVRILVGFGAAAAALSGVSVSILLCYIFWQAFRIIRQKRVRRLGWPSALQMFFVSLLISDLFLSVGTLINAAWVHDAGISKGPLCTTQAILRIGGHLGVAFAILVIAILTWAIIVMEWSWDRPRLAAVVVLIIWIASILMSSVQLAVPGKHDFFGPSGYWCSISPSEGLLNAIVFDMGWLWLVASLEVVLYLSIASTIYSRRGNLGSESLRSSRQRSLLTVAFQMTWYPIIYVITILPLSVDRVWYFAQSEPPFLLTAISLVLFTLSGFFNVLLFTITRPTLIPRPAPDIDPLPRRIRHVSNDPTILMLERRDTTNNSVTSHKSCPDMDQMETKRKDPEVI
ncbi:hypothetical protein SISSUDRAFT_1049446 [Sistotremastrum suecicum HHB10207 ss-3]|uniref:G-protein coupled receptors family 1 profile domain-containing protein n=1 Tax=Sistotremastrum suecicum HHB10207 ss-3 TaxID=1314776 RepID=A0A166BVH7_9AGAM|nr:hypothetical protein SISSUDRAFT_1049446 [Sistotremastrum suecicum HHB10207 ss-3]